MSISNEADVTSSCSAPTSARTGKLYKNLIGIYGREKLDLALRDRTIEEVIADIQGKAKTFQRRPEDVDCMRRRMRALKSPALERRRKGHEKGHSFIAILCYNVLLNTT